MLTAVQGGAGRFGGQLQYGPIETIARIANGELRRVNTDGDAARSGVDVIPRQCALPLFIECAECGERQRMGGNHDAVAQMFAR